MDHLRVKAICTAGFLLLAACTSKRDETNVADTSAPAMAPAPAAMDTGMKMDTRNMDTTASTPAVGTSKSHAARRSPTARSDGAHGNWADYNGYVHVAGVKSASISVDGIPTVVPDDGIISLGNGTHHINCGQRDVVITVGSQPRTDPLAVSCG